MRCETNERSRWNHPQWLSLLVAFVLCGTPLPAETRIKDLADIEGIRENQLIGYGLVAGLAGSGDRFQTQFTIQTIRNLLDRMGLTVPQAFLRVTNTAAVMVTATLPAFSQPGTKIDVTVAAMGDATNIHGGVLLLTPLRGVDGQVYALSQGPVVTGGFAAGRPSLGTVSSLNHPNTGRVPAGGIVERPAPSVMPAAEVRLQLRTADFANAARIASAINEKFKNGDRPVAVATNPALVAVTTPADQPGGSAAFVAELQALRIETDQAARIVVNERTGTVVVGSQVRIAPTAIMHGSLSVEVQTRFEVSQPAPFAQGTTQVTPDVNVNVREEQTRHVALGKDATVEDLVRALSAIGVTARDIISILQALRAAGALEAELEVI
ncbi:MAG: flagellar basal body P-ring protein FlgI [Bryobacterales bacterium]|nr:flagellar basal body P-ring protein FlgI [Bryobacterales bacterium]